MLDATGHSILWRIRDAARFTGSTIHNMTSTPVAPDGEGRHRQLRESTTPQWLNRLSTAHSAIEDGLKYLIKRRGASYSHTHDLRTLLDELRMCDSRVATSLDNAFAAATEFHGTDTLDTTYRHLALLPDCLEKAGAQKLFELMRYCELESSIDDPALGCIHIS